MASRSHPLALNSEENSLLGHLHDFFKFILLNIHLKEKVYSFKRKIFKKGFKYNSCSYDINKIIFLKYYSTSVSKWKIQYL